MKKTFKEYEEMGADKEYLKFRYKRGCDLEKRFDKLIDKSNRIFPKGYHDLVYLDHMNFHLYGIKEDINKFLDEWVAKVENIARMGKKR